MYDISNDATLAGMCCMALLVPHSGRIMWPTFPQEQDLRIHRKAVQRSCPRCLKHGNRQDAAPEPLRNNHARQSVVNKLLSALASIVDSCGRMQLTAQAVLEERW
jgi:hypothetical protein